MRFFPVTLLLAGFLTVPAIAATGKSGNTALLTGADIFENITESAYTLDQAKYAKLMADYRAQAAAIEAALPPGQRDNLHDDVAKVHSSWKQGDRNAMALGAVDAYRVLVTAVNRSGMPVPLDVALLDYTGFRLKALAGGKRPDWAAISSTVVEGQGFWQKLKPQVRDTTLVAAMDRSMRALANAARDKDPKLLAYATDMDLILVDGLETWYKQHPPTP